MKKESSNFIKDTEKPDTRAEIIHSSVKFSGQQNSATAEPDKESNNFLQKLKDAIDSGDDTTWRMWR